MIDEVTAVMMDPEVWINRPFLPLIRRRPGKEDELGFLYEHPIGGGIVQPRVYLANMYNTKNPLVIQYWLPNEVVNLTSITYQNFRLISLDGWEIDEEIDNG